MIWLYIAVGGALGALSRYGLREFFDYLFLNREWVESYAIQPTTLATFTANITGSLLIGLVLPFVLSLSAIGSLSALSLQAFFIIGFCGSFTTFSTFSWEVIHFLQNQQYSLAITYILLSLFCSLTAVWLGFQISK